MTAQWIFVIIAAFAVVSSLAFLVIYAAVVASARKSQKADRIGELPTILFPVTNGKQADEKMLTNNQRY